jgi:bile acid-coenzyme A ligase
MSRFTFGERIAEIAREAPDEVALVGFDQELQAHTVTWRAFDEESRTAAEELRTQSQGGPGFVVPVAAANTVEAVVHMTAVLRAELTLLPVNPRAPRPEQARLVEFVQRHHGPVLPDHDATPSPQAPSAEGTPRTTGASVLLSTGGSSGDVKIVPYRTALVYEPSRMPDPLYRYAGWRSWQRQLIVAPLHHAAPFSLLLAALLDANTIILQRIFWPQWTLELIERYRVEWVQLAPSHMRAMLQLGRPDRTRLASLNAILHTAAPCDVSTKRAWIELLGPRKVFEMYASTEDVGATVIRGDEWLDRPGSVGRGFFSQIRVFGPDGRRLPPNEVGKVFVRRPGLRRDRRYLGGRSMETTVDGFVSMGDYGHLDDDGYLFLAPRRIGVINSGGENVYPSEVESVLLEHPDVLDAVALAAEDSILGEAVQARVVRRDGGSTTPADLIAFCSARLAPHKVPRTITWVGQVPRSESGKLERWRVDAAPPEPGTDPDSQVHIG